MARLDENFTFSVIIPLYNKENFIRASLDSVFNQSYDNFEIIVVNDGSSDGSREIVESIKDTRLRLFNKENGGVSSARNYGLQHAGAKYVAFLDADDLWMPNHLSTIVELLHTFPGEKIFATSYMRIQRSGSIVIALSGLSYGEAKMIDYFNFPRNDGFFWTSAIAVDRELVSTAGGFDLGLSHGEDRDLWIRLCLTHKIVYKNIETAIYNLESENNSGRAPKNLDKFFASRLHKYLGINRQVDYFINIKYFQSFLSYVLVDEVIASKYKNIVKIRNLKLTEVLMLLIPMVLLRQILFKRYNADSSK